MWLVGEKITHQDESKLFVQVCNIELQLDICCLCSAETDNSQRVLDNDSTQHLKLRERQRFFEEVYQQDVDNYLPSAHLQIDSRKRA